MNYDGVCFFQCIEGESSVIDSLYASIVADPRHSDVVTLSNEPISRRRFHDWSMHFHADTFPDHSSKADGDDEAADELVNPNRSMRLTAADLVVLGGRLTVTPSMPIEPRLELAGRRWHALSSEVFVARMSDRQFDTVTDVAEAIVDMLLLAHRRGPAVLPNLKAFLSRRTDLVHRDLGKACKTLLCTIHGRGDALDSLETVTLMTALVSVTFAIQSLTEAERGALGRSEIRRRMLSLCLAALDQDTMRPPAARPALKGARAWLYDLVGQGHLLSIGERMEVGEGTAKG
jgi:hypothetical protein